MTRPTSFVVRATLLLAGGAAAATLAGCIPRPVVQTPDAAIPAAYRGKASTLPSLGDVPWRQVFTEPQLQLLIEEGLSRNLDVLIAGQRVREADAILLQTYAQKLPAVNVGFGTTPIARQPGDTFTSSFLLGVSASWEIDLWGRYARATDAAIADVLVTEESRYGVKSSLVAQIASLWYQIASLRENLAIAQRTAVAQGESLRLVRRLADAGINSMMEVRQAETQLATTQAAIPPLVIQIGQTENALSVLVGRAPGTIDTQPVASLLPPVIPAGLPSRLIEQRPDVRQAEQALAGATSRLAEAKTLLLPQIALTGTLGLTSTSLRSIWRGSAPEVVSLGPGVNWPVYSGGALEANVEANRARLDQAALAYRKQVLVALKEVADGLVAYEQSANAAAANAVRVNASREALRLANMRFRSGVSSYLEVLDAERQLFQSETELVRSELDRRNAYVQVYRALGGGWEPNIAPPASPASPAASAS